MSEQSTVSPSIAFVTMVRNEPIFLPIWVKYYSRFVPKSQLHVIFDGMDQVPPPETDGCQILILPAMAYGPGWDARRWLFLERFVATLLARYDVVVLNDVDEIIVIDPAQSDDLISAMMQAKELGAISPFALEIIHRTDIEAAPFDPASGVLAQRHHVRINASYSKPCIIAQPVHWSTGGHYSDYPRLHLSRNLFLFHLRFMDRDILLDRQRQRLAATTLSREAAGEPVAGSGWDKSFSEIDEFLRSFINAGLPQVKDFQDFGWQRRKIERSWKFDDQAGIWRHDTLHNRKSYTIPERFVDLF